MTTNDLLAIIGIMLERSGATEITITREDINRMASAEQNLLVRFTPTAFTTRLATERECREKLAMASEPVGKPV